MCCRIFIAPLYAVTFAAILMSCDISFKTVRPLPPAYCIPPPLHPAKKLFKALLLLSPSTENLAYGKCGFTDWPGVLQET